ncbi:MAG: SagB/ThcOx family dehydrogenase [Desulfobacterales bacterium]
MKLIPILLTVLLALPALAAAQEFKAIDLPAPQKETGKPLIQALNDRHTSRNFSSEKLPKQMLSNLLWAAFGINRPDSGKRTAPSAMNWQEIDIYIASAEGLYLYNALEHRLDPVLEKDIRAETGTQGFVGEAPINLVYVADYSKMSGAAEDRKRFYAAADTGFISQNVYLYCASTGLATVVRGSVPRSQLAKIMNLTTEQHITLAQTVGFPGN